MTWKGANAKVPPDPDRVTPEQHSLGRSVLLHLFPGAVLTAFVVIAAPAAEALGFPPVFALFAGIGLVIVPLELGYLMTQARRTTGSWSPLGVVTYRTRLSMKTYALWGFALFAWFTALLIVAQVWLDRIVADRLFSWMPHVILQFSSLDGGEPVGGARLAVVLIVAFVFNGLVGPVTEELYFRGHLLPRIDRFGRWAPVINAVLFSAYHFWTPWQNLTRIIGVLPWSWAAWRARSVYLPMAAHVAVNNVFLLLFTAVALGSGG